ncbi:MAG TPA: 16S rRNA (cytosine(1402)-N(4))-methyltransferase RsmH, partial [Candidatus Tumulicola sp.]|nr:16S rRNA (cytosine(1402)-N(4))-methyltransferase RsmH [Candidatus Tumulicola sp.]
MTHVPVLLETALEYLAVAPDGIYVDATFGAGGHSRAILEPLTTGRLIALDADPSAEARARRLSDPRLTFVHANFRELSAVLDGCGVGAIDGALFDLGVSSMQFDDPERGFSIGKAAPLDMRMDPHERRSAYDVLATASERELADIFFQYGEERSARRIAHAIVARRSAGRLPTTTTEFASLVAAVLRRPGRRERLHPATRVFQALRIAVNDELGALRDGLGAAIDRLRGAGRIVAISFHSLEDRRVKEAFRDDPRLTRITKRPL